VPIRREKREINFLSGYDFRSSLIVFDRRRKTGSRKKLSRGQCYDFEKVFTAKNCHARYEKSFSFRVFEEYYGIVEDS
jgi:hypothetical protein